MKVARAGMGLPASDSGTKGLDALSRWAVAAAGDGKQIWRFDKFMLLAGFLNFATCTLRLETLTDVRAKHFAVYVIFLPSQFYVEYPRSSLDAVRRLFILVSAFQDAVWALHGRRHAAAASLLGLVENTSSFHVGQLALYPELTEAHLHQFLTRLAGGVKP